MHDVTVATISVLTVVARAKLGRQFVGCLPRFLAGFHLLSRFPRGVAWRWRA